MAALLGLLLSIPRRMAEFRIEVRRFSILNFLAPLERKSNHCEESKRGRLLMYHSAIRWVYWVIQVEQPPPTRYKWDDDTDIEGIRDQSMSRLPHQTPPFWPWSRKIWPKQPRPHSLWSEISKIVLKLLGHFLFIISKIWFSTTIIAIFWLEMIRNNIV